MADQRNKPRRFSIRPVERTTEVKRVEEPVTVPVVDASPPVEEEEIKAPVDIDSSTGGLFRVASQALSFLSSAMGSSLVDEADVRRSTNGAFWVEVDAPSESIAHLIWISNGQAFRNIGDLWAPVRANAQVVGGEEEDELFRVDTWEEISLAQMLTASHLLPSRYIPTESLVLIAPGALGQTILRRAIALNIEVEVLPAVKEMLLKEADKKTGVLMMRLKAKEGKNIPVSLVKTLCNLPYVFVGNIWESGNSRVLVDVNHRSPLSPLILVQLVPEGEVWMLGAPENGHWRIRTHAQPVDGTNLMEVNIPPFQLTESPSDAAIPKPLAVQLVHIPGQRMTIDAVLLDETELDWLVTLLKNRPVEESAFLFFGSGKYLLTAPGGLSSNIPFGVPLSWQGPGGFYVESGKGFYPSLPESARKERFELSPENMVVVTSDAAYRFNLDQMIPAWNLWIGEVPEIKTNTLSKGRYDLSQYFSDAQLESYMQPLFHSKLFGSMPKPDRTRLLKQAQREEAAGNLIKAAQLLEKAGYPGPAGRLYERAAKG